MASSGWQAEKLIWKQSSSSSHYGRLSISSITHTGNTVRISGTLRYTFRSTWSGGTSWYNFPVSASISGDGTVDFGSSFSAKNESKNVDRTFTATLNASSSATSVNLSATYTSTGDLGTHTLTWTLSIDPGGTAPATPTVSVVSVADTSAVLHVAVSSYGDPASATGRYIEGGIMAQNSYGGTYRAKKVTDVSSADVTVGNSSSDFGSLNIVPNTRYYFGAYANNTVLSANTVAGQILMLPAYITNVVANDDGTGNITVSVIHANEGTDDTAYTEYSYDQSTWNAVQDEFHITAHSATTIYIRRENSTGTTPVYQLNIVPTTTVKLYGSVNGESKEIKTLYGSVGGQSKKIVKLYGSVNGRSKLIYEDLA